MDDSGSMCAVGQDIETMSDSERREFFYPACADPPFSEATDGKLYCVLHLPNGDKSADFEAALRKKLDSASENRRLCFRGVWFPQHLSDLANVSCDTRADFSHAIFNEGADFSYTIFNEGADFSYAVFGDRALFFGTIFHGRANFSHTKCEEQVLIENATFNEKANFDHAEFVRTAAFRDTYFESAWFTSCTFCDGTQFRGTRINKEAVFAGATFSKELQFGCACNSHIIFHWTRFLDHVSFGSQVFSDEGYVSFRYARMGNPTDITFYGGQLHPAWFIYLNGLHSVNFISVRWHGIPDEVEAELHTMQPATAEDRTETHLNESDTEPGNITEEESVISIIEEMEVPQEFKHGALARAARELAVNSEEARRYEEAAQFRYLSLEAQRKEPSQGLALFRLIWWHWLLSGYSEKPFVAFTWLLMIWMGFAVLYALGSLLGIPLGFELAGKSVSPLSFPQALVYSLGTMTRLSPVSSAQSVTAATQLFVFLEGILGPLQIGLFLLAIRRKVMR